MSTTSEQQTTSALGTVWGWVVGFGRFWYEFIIGDDWRIAAAVLGALLLTWALSATSVPAWWLVPVAVIAVTYLTLLDRANAAKD
jgi:hypothetical protein